MITYLVLILNISNITGSAFNLYTSYKEASLGRRYISISSIIISVILLITYIDKAMSHLDFIYYNQLLSMPTAFLWTVICSLFFLYPILEYRSDLISKSLFIKILHPTFILGILILSFSWLNFPFTKIFTWNELLANVHLHDVQFRLLLTLITTAIAIFYLYFPLILSIVSRATQTRKFTKSYYSFFIAGNLLIILYLPFSLMESTEIKLAFRLLNILFLNAITFSYMIPQLSITLLNRDTDSLGIQLKAISTKQTSNNSKSSFVKSLHHEILKYKFYLNPSISIDDLAKQLGTTRPVVTDMIAKMDYSGYYEYMNTLRVSYFKDLVLKSPKKSISELCSQSGFATLTSFNRIFQQMESITPAKYIEKLQSVPENISLKD